MTSSKRQPTALSLFAGAGGCSLGFHDCCYDIVYSLDLDPAAVSTYRTNFPKTRCDLADIRTVNFPELMRELGLGVGELDVLIGGPPCQGFSTAGMRFWDDPRNALLKSYVAALGAILPKWFLMENVEGLLTAKDGEYLFEAVRAFVELGYLVRVEKVYAHEYGVPQRRKRVIVMGNRLGLPFDLPPTTSIATGNIFRNGEMTLRHAIAGLPSAQPGAPMPVPYEHPASSEWEARIRNPQGSVSDHSYPSIGSLQLRRILSLRPGQTMKDLPPDLQHTSFKARAKRRVKDGTPTEKRGGAPSGLKRLFYDEPCLTITGAATREFIHPQEDRALTIRECARIQTFPDSFEFSGTSADRIQQIGNAIPPALARLFANKVQSCGFERVDNRDGQLLGFALTKASAMSPALERTHARLNSLLSGQVQMSLFGQEAGCQG
jgi:DNA (cytosine-5)-methyltransferase 1